MNNGEKKNISYHRNHFKNTEANFTTSKDFKILYKSLNPNSVGCSSQFIFLPDSSIHLFE